MRIHVNRGSVGSTASESVNFREYREEEKLEEQREEQEQEQMINVTRTRKRSTVMGKEMGRRITSSNSISSLDHAYIIRNRKTENNKGRNKKRRKRGKGRSYKMGNENNNNFKMLYANVQGMLGIGKLERWDKINRLCEENRWDVIAFTETHWREGSKTGSIKGYQIFEKRRGIEEKKGGGLAV